MSLLRLLWDKWLAFSKIVGNFTGRIVLTLLYFTIFLPFGVGVRLTSDILRSRAPHADSYWVDRKPVEATIDVTRNQY